MQIKRLYNLLYLPVAIFIAAPSFADSNKLASEIVRLEGREVILKQDGSWQYRNDDRYAVTQDGRRVILNADGSWKVIGIAPTKPHHSTTTPASNLQLEKVIIENFRKKVQKNVTLKTQTVFFIDFTNTTKNTLHIQDSELSLIEVQDDAGKTYEVLSANLENNQVSSGEKKRLKVRVKKSPSIWDDAKSISITFKPGILQLTSPVTLSYRTADIMEVDGE